MFKNKTFLLLRLKVIVGVTALAGVLSACGGQSETKVNTSSETPIADSNSIALVEPLPNRFAEIEYPNASSHSWSGPQEIFEKTCSYCHSTGIGPELLGRQLPPVFIKHVARNGLNGMPAFRHTDFTDEELMSLGKWVQASAAPAKKATSKQGVPK